MEAKAINRYIGTSPRKMRLVVDLIRGKSVGEAINILHFSPKHASKTAEKVLRSAIANAQQKTPNVDVYKLYISRIQIGGGPVAKRIRPAPMGRAFRVVKRTSHVQIYLDEKGR